MVISSIPVSYSSLPHSQRADHTPGLSIMSAQTSTGCLQSLSQHPVPFAAGWHDWKQGFTRLPIQNPGTKGTVQKQRNADSWATAWKGAVHNSAKVTEDTRCHSSCLSHWELSTSVKPLPSYAQKQTTGSRAKVEKERMKQRVTRCVCFTARLPSHSLC